jgi:hypothetical protein
MGSGDGVNLFVEYAHLLSFIIRTLSMIRQGLKEGPRAAERSTAFPWQLYTHIDAPRLDKAATAAAANATQDRETVCPVGTVHSRDHQSTLACAVLW